MCEQPRPTGAPQRQGSAGPDGLMSPPSAWPCVLDSPEARGDLCQPPEPPEPGAHSHAHMEECQSAGLWCPTLPSPGAFFLVFHPLDFGYPLNCHIPFYLIPSSSPSPM